MSRQALGAFEQDGTGDWVCVQSTEVPVNGGPTFVPVMKGRRFRHHTAFAGYTDFTTYLENNAVDGPSIAPAKRE